MKVVVLSRNRKLYSTRRLAEACALRGHEVEVINHLKCYVDIASNRPSVHYGDERLPVYDAVIPRIGSTVTEYGTAVLRQFEMMGTYPLNESVAISRARNSLRSLQLLARGGIGLPLTGFACSTESTQELIRIVGGAPLVLKLSQSSRGKGVFLAETEQAAQTLIDAFRELDANFLVQEFIKESHGSRIRCLVIGEKVVAAMKYTARPGEFRSNLHRGASTEVVRLTPEERSTAVRAAKIMGLNLSGVDLLRSYHGPVVLEVSSTPGLRSIEETTGKDIARLIVDFIEKVAKPHHTRARGQG
ncbi:30S ribosomal protein S6--L-glutamate ligase [Marinobacterium rhizophilum]|uniref:30S ribosomal protein S6--L-glutamate ligase n=1 Tax=Marinobacterium rhizophilum TaxID=420402 RepID=UPI00037DB1A7|nr:30S ribosomal protein S6--L-glutamate ligase [Marinobacterium rhizophilum]